MIARNAVKRPKNSLRVIASTAAMKISVCLMNTTLNMTDGSRYQTNREVLKLPADCAGAHLPIEATT